MALGSNGGLFARLSPAECRCAQRLSFPYTPTVGRYHRDGGNLDMVMSQTMPRMDVATAMLVALEDRIAGVCVTLLDDAGFRVIRVKHVAPALERMPVVMPHLVVVPTNLRKDEDEGLADRCVAIGAEVLRLAPDVDARALVALVASAAHTSLEKPR